MEDEEGDVSECGDDGVSRWVEGVGGEVECGWDGVVLYNNADTYMCK